ncbi:MAG: hypothetical protein HC771_22220 [Synechococcales cyanobacterium CRU_2_2]|nr:hypothetical protein [Synechococcales cyanobacterium CRU_2_2]
MPDPWGKKHLPSKAVNTILNRTPLTARTNRDVIRDRLPNAYLPELIEANGEAEVRKILSSHFISPIAQEILMRDPFTPEDFEAFVSERQRTIQGAIESLLIKERLDLPVELRELDARVELVELKLRQLVDQELKGDGDALPQNVQLKVDERLQRAIRKNAALDPSDFETLKARLEYFDLRELQDTFVGKKLWPKFEPCFNNKTVLSGKFDQLAELRNSLRHSRAVTEIAQKEGEAAILWFDQVLAKQGIP